MGGYLLRDWANLLQTKMNLDKSWKSKRGGMSYIKGVQQFVNFAKENTVGQTQFPCPCQHWKNSKGHIDLDEISLHLLKNGMHQSYVVWKHHGEKARDFGGNIPIMANLIEEPPIEESNFHRLEDLVNDVYNIHTKEAEHSPINVSVTNKECEGDDTIVEPVASFIIYY
ncbi:uncharacterized protein M6B38_299950 [Iris pallida]|uniref:Transposase-associated domain-containing protein n=1 Tax=Iris pallida TaxID=29817 RepID=A0AAX6HQW6_IRIPA|nr:uncharacterized protein M6B38_299950 [Iris pallida]